MTTTTAAIVNDTARRHDFVLLFDITDGNPNGDPDAGNLPRVDPETMQGLVTDVALKRKVRDWVDATQEGTQGMEIYVQHYGVLNNQHQRAYDAKGLKSTGSKQARKDIDLARAWMCETFYDIRLFGAVMTTGVNCGQVRGPIQLTFARSIDPIIPLDLSITRVAVTRSQEQETAQRAPRRGQAPTSGHNDDAEEGKLTEMGRKAIVPYGLYRAHGFFTPRFADVTGVTEQDLALFWQALQNMWDLDHSSSRGLVACRGLYVFSHANSLGNAPAHELFDRVTVTRNDGVEAPRRFADYTVAVDNLALPSGITLTPLVGRAALRSQY